MQVTPTATTVETEAARRFRRSAQIGRALTKVNMFVLWLVLCGGAVLFMLPLYVMVVMSLKTAEEIANTSMWAWPVNPTFENYRRLIFDESLNFGRKFVNTLILSVVPTVASVLTGAMVAYPFARLNFVARDRLFILLLSTMMLPGVVTMIPGYVLYAWLGWINTYKPFIIAAFFGGGAFGIFLIRQFMLGIPREMDEAAKIDGASHAVIFWRIILPNCGPVLATLAVFGFVGGFRDLMGPLMILNDPDKMNLEVGLRSLQTTFRTEFHLMMAGSMLVLAPIFLIFLVSQRWFVKGITLTAGK